MNAFAQNDIGCPLSLAFGPSEGIITDLRPAIDARAGVWRIPERSSRVSLDAHFLFLTCLSESNFCVVDPQSAECRYEQSVLLVAGRDHRLTAEPHCKALGICFSKDLLHHATLPILGRLPGHYDVGPKLNASEQHVKSLFLLFAQELKIANKERAAFRNTLLLSMIEAIVANRKLVTRSAAPTHALPEKIQEVLDLIQANLSDPLPLTWLAQEVGVSQYHLARNFRKVMGVGFREYKRSTRLQTACRLLAETRKTLAEVAYECGFTSQSRMNNVFREDLSVTPLEYRNACWNAVETTT